MMRDKTRYERVEEKQGPFQRKRKYIKIQSGREVDFAKAIWEADDNFSSLIRWMTRAQKLPNDEDDDIALETIIERLAVWVEAWRGELEKRTGQKEEREVIELLRNVAGRTPEEAKLYLAKADEKERKLEEG